MYLSKENQQKLINLLAEVYTAEPPKPKINMCSRPRISHIVAEGHLIDLRNLEFTFVCANDTGVTFSTLDEISIRITKACEIEFLAYVLTTIPQPTKEMWETFLAHYPAKDEVIRIASNMLKEAAKLEAQMMAGYYGVDAEFGDEVVNKAEEFVSKVSETEVKNTEENTEKENN